MIKDFEKYLLYEKRFSPHTVSAYVSDVEQFYREAGASTNEIIDNPHTVRAWLAGMIEAGMSNTSVNRKISSLRTYYKFLKAFYNLKNNPLSRISNVKNKKRVPSFVQEQYFDNFNDYFTNDFAGIRDKIILEILYFTGVRRAELVSLKVSDVDFENLRIKVTGKRQKQRLIPINAYLASQIRVYIGEREAIAPETNSLIITNKGKAVYEQFIYRTVKKYMNLLSPNMQASPHTLRHTFATHLLNNGADLNAIKTLLGHSNLSATQIYTHNNFEKLNSIYKQAHPRAT